MQTKLNKYLKKNSLYHMYTYINICNCYLATIIKDLFDICRSITRSTFYTSL